jgi:hypothetical protein
MSLAIRLRISTNRINHPHVLTDERIWTGNLKRTEATTQIIDLVCMGLAARAGLFAFLNFSMIHMATLPEWLWSWI